MVGYKLFAAVALMSALAGCKQELPKTVESKPVFGTVQDLRITDGTKQLLYQVGEDPYKKNWGAAASYIVKVDNVDYYLHWDQAEKFKQLKVGDKVNLHPSEYIACRGEADLKPDCQLLMRVYKSERRINPIMVR